MSRPLALGVGRTMQRFQPRVLRLQVRGWATSSRPSPPGRGTNSNDGGAVLGQTTSFLRNLENGAEIFLVGTAHVSKRSAQEVHDMITLVKPDVVMVELCEGRAQRLLSGQSTSDADFLRDALGSLFAPGSNMGQQMFKLSLQGMYRFFKSLGLEPGGEFKAALQAAEQQGASIVYGDREVSETLKRLASNVDFQDILKLFSGGGPEPPQQMVDFFESKAWESSGAASRIEYQVEAMKTRSMARQMSDFLRQLNPGLAAALIDERDEYMTQRLRQLKGRVVGVVGLAHLDGIERRWETTQNRGLGSSVVIPRRRPL